MEFFGFFGMGILEFWTSYGSVWAIYQGAQEVLGIPLNQVPGEKCFLTGKNQVFFYENGKNRFSIWKHIWLEMEGLGVGMEGWEWKWLKPRQFFVPGKFSLFDQKWDVQIFT